MADLKSVQLLVRNGKKIAAIKELKGSYSGMGLKEAKTIVDGLESGKLSIDKVKAYLDNMPKLTQAVNHENSVANTMTPNTLISRKKTDYTKLLLIVIIIGLLLYIFSLQA